MHAFDARHYEERHDRVAGGTSTLSPYLHFGCLSARELELQVPEPAFRRQLAWRDFYAQVLLHHPGNLRRAFRPELDAIEWTGSDEDFAAWTEGRTGFPLVDAGMRQLAATGWMHNRARLVAASFLAKDLHVDWRRGEAHFMRLLLDGDVAQNNGNWQWVTSVGVDPAPMQRRLYNPELQRRRHDPDDEYVRRWIPELGNGYPEPIVDHAVERRAAIAAYRAAKV
jgi:deoxyribodipyrimidine photo-lyase